MVVYVVRISTLPMNVAPKNVQNGIRKWPQKMPHRSNARFGQLARNSTPRKPCFCSRTREHGCDGGHERTETPKLQLSTPRTYREEIDHPLLEIVDERQPADRPQLFGHPSVLATAPNKRTSQHAPSNRLMRTSNTCTDLFCEASHLADPVRRNLADGGAGAPQEARPEHLAVQLQKRRLQMNRTAKQRQANRSQQTPYQTTARTTTSDAAASCVQRNRLEGFRNHISEAESKLVDLHSWAASMTCSHVEHRIALPKCAARDQSMSYLHDVWKQEQHARVDARAQADRRQHSEADPPDDELCTASAATNRRITTKTMPATV